MCQGCERYGEMMTQKMGVAGGMSRLSQRAVCAVFGCMHCPVQAGLSCKKSGKRQGR